MLRRNGPVEKSVESVLRPEGSLWWERFVKDVGFEAGVKTNTISHLIILVSLHYFKTLLHESAPSQCTHETVYTRIHLTRSVASKKIECKTS